MSEKFDPSTPVTFPRGMYELNDEPHINYQLNRIVNWDGGDLGELREVGPGIHSWHGPEQGRRRCSPCKLAHRTWMDGAACHVRAGEKHPGHGASRTTGCSRAWDHVA